MKKSFSISLMIVGAIIGAGFASGQEIITYFGYKASIFIAFICSLVLFIILFAFLFLISHFSPKSINDFNKYIFGHFHYLFDIFLAINNLIIISSMLSASNILFNNIYKLAPIYSYLLALLAFIITKQGINYIMKISNYCIPCMITVLLFIYVKNINFIDYGMIKILPLFNSYFYICMNMFLTAPLLVNLNHLTKKEIFLISFITSFIVFAILVLMFLAFNSNILLKDSLPIVVLLEKLNNFIKIITYIIIFLSILTTLISSLAGISMWLNNIVKNYSFSIIIILFLSLLMSQLGFINIVNLFYPFIGLVGAIYFIVIIIKFIKLFVFNLFFKISNNKVHNSSQNT